MLGNVYYLYKVKISNLFFLYRILTFASKPYINGFGLDNETAWATMTSKYKPSYTWIYQTLRLLFS